MNTQVLSHPSYYPLLSCGFPYILSKVPQSYPHEEDLGCHTAEIKKKSVL